jgi:hypothetical protein
MSVRPAQVVTFVEIFLRLLAAPDCQIPSAPPQGRLGSPAVRIPHLRWPRIADAIAFHPLNFLEPRCRYDTACQALHNADLALFPAREAAGRQ